MSKPTVQRPARDDKGTPVADDSFSSDPEITKERDTIDRHSLEIQRLRAETFFDPRKQLQMAPLFAEHKRQKEEAESRLEALQRRRQYSETVNSKKEVRALGRRRRFNPETRKRRDLLKQLLEKDPDITNKAICDEWDDHNTPTPALWNANWKKGFLGIHRGNIETIIAKDKKYLSDHA